MAETVGDLIDEVEADGREYQYARGSHRYFEHPTKTRQGHDSRPPERGSAPEDRAEHQETGANQAKKAMKQSFAIVVERSPRGYGAYAPDLPASFVSAENAEDALRGARDALAAQLRLFADLGDRLPAARPETAPGLARANETPDGKPADPDIRVVLVEVGPEDAPPDPAARALFGDAPPSGAGDRRSETFTAVFEHAANNCSAYFPDLPGCVAAADTIREARDLMLTGLADFLQGLVDDGEPIPANRRSVEEALADRDQDDEGADSSPGDRRAFAEGITVEVRPARPAARRLDARWRDARRRRAAFEERAAPTVALAPGGSRSDAWAVIVERRPDDARAYVPDLPGCRVRGTSPEVVRQRLRAAIADCLQRRFEAEGAVPLPRRTPAQALARHHRRRVEYGLEVPDPQATVEMIPVEIAAPRIACAS